MSKQLSIIGCSNDRSYSELLRKIVHLAFSVHDKVIGMFFGLELCTLHSICLFMIGPFCYPVIFEACIRLCSIRLQKGPDMILFNVKPGITIKVPVVRISGIPSKKMTTPAPKFPRPSESRNT